MRAPRTAVALLALGTIAGCGGGDDDAAGPVELASSPVAIPQPSQATLAAGGLSDLPVAGDSARVDLEVSPFSDPTEITNPLFPISELDSAILSGKVDGKPFHTETTLLPQTRFIEWTDGELVEAAVSQYIAYLDGRIEEAALDYYAQADDGSVWYLGEDVYDYDGGGMVDGTEGTWLAGVDGPLAMIMPGDPQLGDIHRAENIPSIAFEEVEVTSIDETVQGPTGPVDGALIGSELHDDGTYSDKTFAPGYGEFFSAHEGDVEAMALAVPADALDGPVPPALERLVTQAEAAIEAVLAERWDAAARDAMSIAHAWHSYARGKVPPRIAGEMERAIDGLTKAARTHAQEGAGNASIDVAQSALDLQLRYRPPTEIDLARFALWARQVLVHEASGDDGGVYGDVATLEWVRDRFAHTLEDPVRTQIDRHILAMRGSVVDREPGVTAAEAERLLGTLAPLTG